MIDIVQARGLLARAVLTKGPDFVYGKDAEGNNLQCYYNPIEDSTISNDPRTTTGCVVGVALSLVGFTVEKDEQDGIEYVGTVEELSYRYPTWMTEDTMQYFKRAQYVQDRGLTWGEAYTQAEKSLDND